MTPASMTKTATVIGSGPNGLSAAIVLAQAGLKVDVYEAETIPGGGCRTLELTLPGFRHDFGSAVHPMAAGSPFFQQLPLEQYGLEWIYSPAPLAHPFPDGSVVTLEQDLAAQARVLGRDGKAWVDLFGPLAARWSEIREAILQPFTPFSPPIWRHPFLMARFGIPALMPSTLLARGVFREAPARALFAGLAAHSFLSLDSPLSASFGLVLGMVGHAIGWPIPKGGSQSITTALVGYFESLGGTLHTAQPIAKLSDLPPTDVTLCDVTPRQLLALAGDRLSPAYGKSMQKYRYGPAAFKVDYALSQPIPWTARECLRAATVHVGGSMEEIAISEKAMSEGRVAERPFLLVAQSSLFDDSRTPAAAPGQPALQTAWVYCHVPNGCTVDMLPVIESQLERFAPGFRDCVLGRSVLSPARLEAMNANLVGGDINGGAMSPTQFVLRPTGGFYKTSARDLFLCSSSTPPGGGVHGMCGHNAALEALRFLNSKD
jgi:phytoene dehydrogenase-like protein